MYYDHRSSLLTGRVVWFDRTPNKFGTRLLTLQLEQDELKKLDAELADYTSESDVPVSAQDVLKELGEYGSKAFNELDDTDAWHPCDACVRLKMNKHVSVEDLPTLNCGDLITITARLQYYSFTPEGQDQHCEGVSLQFTDVTV